MSLDDVARIAERLLADFDARAPGRLFRTPDAIREPGGRGSARLSSPKSARAWAEIGSHGGSPSHPIQEAASHKAPDAIREPGGRGSVRAWAEIGSHGGSPSHYMESLEPLGKPMALAIAEAYAVQAEVARLRQERGERIVGYKVGCTSKAIQEQLGVIEPIFGRIFDTGCSRCGASLSHADFANLAVEGELAVRLGKDLCGPAVSEQAARDAIEAVFPIIELHHYVISDAWPAAQWLIATSGMHAGFVFAEPGSSIPHAANWAQRLCVRINENRVGAVDNPASIVCPVESLRWLTGRLAQFGLKLYKGQVILTGSPMNLFPVGPGSRVVVEAPPLGTSFVEIVA